VFEPRPGAWGQRRVPIWLDEDRTFQRAPI
jgi:hypothetical protein